MSQVVAILGGGQLAQMLGAAASSMGVRCRVLDPAPDACAARTCEHVLGGYDNPASLRRLVTGASTLTFEFENVPASLLDEAEHLGIPARPNGEALRTASDRLAEKQLFESIGMVVPPFQAVGSLSDLTRAVDNVGCPLVLKSRSGGYDGRSQARVDRPEAAQRAWETIGCVPCLAERRVELLDEISVITCRGRSGEVRLYPLVSNTHSDSILVRSQAPATLATPMAEMAQAWATELAIRLDYTGVLALELFLTPDGIMANEFAPRVHNTGHWTINGAECSQFVNHIRAVLGMELGSTQASGHSVMRNLIGSVPANNLRARHTGIHWHEYGKAARPGRKLGHVNITAPTASECQELECSLKLEPVHAR